MPLLGSYMDRDDLKIAIGGVAGVRQQLVDGTFLADSGDIASWVLFVESRLVIRTSEINARLRKRYAVPFADPTPEVVKGWLAALVLPDLYEARGWDDSDAHAQSLKDAAALAREQMKEAADSDVGLYDLPLAQDDTTSAISKGGPQGYSEQSPYSWTDAQSDAVGRGDP